MKCRIQIRLTESNYFGNKLSCSLGKKKLRNGKKNPNPKMKHMHILSPPCHSYKLCAALVLSMFVVPLFFFSHQKTSLFLWFVSLSLSLFRCTCFFLALFSSFISLSTFLSLCLLNLQKKKRRLYIAKSGVEYVLHVECNIKTLKPQKL